MRELHKYKSWQLLQSHVDVIDSWPRKVHKVQVEFMVKAFEEILYYGPVATATISQIS